MAVEAFLFRKAGNAQTGYKLIQREQCRAFTKCSKGCVKSVYPHDAAPIIWLSSRDEVQICRGGADAVFENFTGVAVLSVTLYQTCHILYH